MTATTQIANGVKRAGRWVQHCFLQFWIYLPERFYKWLTRLTVDSNSTCCWSKTKGWERVVSSFSWFVNLILNMLWFQCQLVIFRTFEFVLKGWDGARNDCVLTLKDSWTQLQIIVCKRINSDWQTVVTLQNTNNVRYWKKITIFYSSGKKCVAKQTKLNRSKIERVNLKMNILGVGFHKVEGKRPSKVIWCT